MPQSTRCLPGSKNNSSQPWISITRSSGGFGTGEGICDSISETQKSGLRFMRRINGAARSTNSCIATNSGPVASSRLANNFSMSSIALSAPSRTKASRCFSNDSRAGKSRFDVCFSRSRSGELSWAKRRRSSLPAIMKSWRSCARSAAIWARCVPTIASVSGNASRSATNFRSGLASHCDQIANQRAMPVSMLRAPG